MLLRLLLSSAALRLQSSSDDRWTGGEIAGLALGLVTGVGILIFCSVALFMKLFGGTNQAAAREMKKLFDAPPGTVIKDPPEGSPEREAMIVMKEMSKCDAGWEWRRTETGFVCGGGGHTITNEQLEAKLKEMRSARV